MDGDASAGPAKTVFSRTTQVEADEVHERDTGVLVLSPGVTLTLGKDSLLIPGIGGRNITLTKNAGQLVTKPSRSCLCGNNTPSSIPYYNILWADIADDRRWLVVDYAHEDTTHHLVARKVKFAIPEEAAGSGDQVSAWIERLLDHSYGSSARRKRAWVLVNPHAGPGGADKIWEKQVKPIFEAARMPLTVVRTTYSGEGVDLAQVLDIDNFDIAIPCSGDGLPHEVFNGLAKRPDARRALSKIAVCHIPCGSGNAMSCNLYGTHRPTLAALAIIKGITTPLDLVSITQGDQRYVSFLSQALGVIAHVDLGTEHLRWMGAARFTVGFLTLVLQKKTYPCDIAVKVEIEHKQGVKNHYRKQVAGSESEASDENSKLCNGTDSDACPVFPPASQADDDAPSLGMPPLKYGTVTEKLPEGWELVSHENLGSFYCGNMAYMAPDANFFSAALANDGLMDLITTDGDVSPLKSVGLQLSVESGEFFDNPLVSYRKVSAYRVIPRNQEKGCYLSIDGESKPLEPFQAEVHKGLGLVISKRGIFEAPGPLNWDKVTTSERLLA
ncbi:putative phingoid long chain base kinase [Podospora australis]|uniref:Phingoid long chain base kinase n=1 Tax=Podospora australis TaxID=1536484 RepID=A0AAN7AK15_9PEZI|nr:putative phingoid long chain base kinase [Podospora australis]